MALLLQRRRCASQLVPALAALLRAGGADSADGMAGTASRREWSSSAASSSWRSHEPLYPTHVRLHAAQRAAVAIGSAFGALFNPARADLVAALGETTGWGALIEMRDRMRKSPTGRQVLLAQPRVTNASVAPAWEMPEGTFGAAYARFMGDRNFQADERPPVRFVDDAELAYVAQRAREVHDFWHVLFACHTNVLGELTLKAVEAVQTGMPMTALSVAAGPLKLKPRDRQLLLRELLPWALRAGAAADDLMCIYYENHFAEDLEELRERWRITTAPQVFTQAQRAAARSAAPAVPSSSSAGGGSGEAQGA